MKSNVLSFLFGSQKNVKAPAVGEAASHSVADIVWPEGGWSPAGYLSTGEYSVFSRKTGRLVYFRPKQLDEANFRAHMGNGYCNANHIVEDPKSKKAVFKAELLADEIRDECDKFGPANPDAVRAPGLHLGPDESLVVHYGNAVYDHDDRPVSTEPSAKCVYVAGPSIGFGQDTPCATKAEVEGLERVFESFNFVESWGAMASMGWTASAFYGAVLPHHPSLLLQAERGSGKTTWVELQEGMLGSQAFRRDGVPSVPQVIYALEERSLALLNDEFEARPAKRASIEALSEIFNAGFTSSGSARIARVYGGKMRVFNPPAGVALCGINLPVFEEALESRSVRLHLARKDRSAEDKSTLLDSINRDEVEALGARVRRLLAKRWPVMNEVRKLLHGMLLKLGHESRAADRLSPLLAGYVAMTCDTVPGHEALVELLRRWGLTEVKASETVPDCEVCLDVLLDRKVAVFYEEDGKPAKAHMRVRDVVQRLFQLQDDKDGRRPLEKQLELFGLKLMHNEGSGNWKLAVASSEHNASLRRMFHGTPSAAGGWREVLARLPGATKGNQRLAGVSVKVVVVSLPNPVVQVESDDEDAKPAEQPGNTDEVRTVRREWLN